MFDESSESTQPLLLIPESSREKPGDRVGSYILEQQIGDGASATVFRARHLQLERQVVLKILRAEHAHNARMRARFFREGRAANRVHHPNTIQVVDVAEDTGPSGLPRLYLVMEWYDGETLLDRVRHQTPSPLESVRWIRQVCAGLEATHAAGVVHRDIKPENLWLTRDGEVKLIDFGSADVRELRLRTTTLEGLVVGTPMYIAPERLSGQPGGIQSDVYSTAAVLYELLAGHPPFHGEGVEALTGRVCHEPAPPLPIETPGGHPVPRGLRDLVLRALDKAPARRPASMGELARALEPYAQALPRLNVGTFQWPAPAQPYAD
jgi:serine/threonine-protein kinase